MDNQIFTADFFKNNRQRLLSESKLDLIIIPGSADVQKSLDTAYPFQQDNNFFYLTGINESENILVIRPGNKSYLIMAKENHIHDIFEGSADLTADQATSGLELLLNNEEGWKKLKADLKSAKKAGTLLPSPAYNEYYRFFVQPFRRQIINRIKRYQPDIELVDLRRSLATMRTVKQKPEIAAISQAVNITSQAIQEVSRKLKAGKYNYAFEIEADLFASFRSKGAQGHAFQPIVALGDRAVIVHYSRNDQPISPNQLLLMDVGCGYSFYASDISRTYQVGQATDRQQQVHAAVKKVQAAVIEAVKPGVNIRELDKLSENLIGEELIKLGLIDELDTEKIRTYYPYSVGHSLGLDVHDAADYTMNLTKDMVITVEPGIHIPEESIAVRIEDDILVTADGHINLSQSLTSSIEG